MDSDLILQLEQKIDQLLVRHQAMADECARLTAERSALLAERERFGAELDRILAKLDRLDRESP